MRLGVAACLLLVGPAMLSACALTPPQIDSVSPVRGAVNVPTNVPIKIAFADPVYRSQVEQRFSLSPRAQGTFAWKGRVMYFRHSVLASNHVYTVILRSGYAGPGEMAEPYEHRWTFTTEQAPVISSTDPARGSDNVSTGVQISIGFTRPMNLTSLAKAITSSPHVDFWLTASSLDPSQVLLTPKTVLSPDTKYILTISRSAVDAHGNPLRKAQEYDFTTGGQQALSQVVTFLAQPGVGSPPGVVRGVWITGSSGLPQLLVGGTFSSYQWDSTGTEMLLGMPNQSWALQSIGEGSLQELPFQATWAAWDPAAPAGKAEFLYLTASGDLYLFAPPAPDQLLMTGVNLPPAVQTQGIYLAAVSGTGVGQAIDVYDLQHLQTVAHFKPGGEVEELQWSPNGPLLGYEYFSPAAGQMLLQAQNLAGEGPPTTLAQGDLSAFAWAASGSQVVLAASLSSSSGDFRCYAVNLAAPAPLVADTVLPAGTSQPCGDPVTSPDGHQIAFIDSATAAAPVWLMNADGSNPRPLLPEKVASGLTISGVTWSP